MLEEKTQKLKQMVSVPRRRFHRLQFLKLKRTSSGANDVSNRLAAYTMRIASLWAEVA
jgi:hypothetical protein